MRKFSVLLKSTEDTHDADKVIKQRPVNGYITTIYYRQLKEIHTSIHIVLTALR